MNRYLLFGYCQYEAGGGMNDLAGTYATIVEAQEEAKKRDHIDHWHILDRVSGDVWNMDTHGFPQVREVVKPYKDTGYDVIVHETYYTNVGEWVKQ